MALSDDADTLRGQTAFSDYTRQKPGTVHYIRPADLPPPDITPLVANPPQIIARPKDAWPQAPAGFSVMLYAEKLNNPRLLRTAPNGDIFVAESRAGRIRILRGLNAAGQAESSSVFAGGLTLPFGIAFFPPGPSPEYIYVCNTGSVVRFPYRLGDIQARAAKQIIIPNLPGGGRVRGGGHWTRDIAFTLDGKKMFVSVGSYSNADDPEKYVREYHRAAILSANPDGSNVQLYAWGIRNAVSIDIHPKTGELWASVNERDGRGDNLVPDYITQVQEFGFYGWPWFYIGPNQDPHFPGKHPELKNKVVVPDVLVQPHNATMQMAFYTAAQFPPEYRNGLFVAQHGSWNRKIRTGYEVIFVPFKNGRATGAYQDFLTGFVSSTESVWGRPVGVTVADDGSLLVSDDGANVIWRVSYTGTLPRTR